MSTEAVFVDTAGAVCTITLNRPHKRNAIDRPTAEALRAAFENFECDDSLRVAVLCGAGGNFCAGADLTAIGDPELRNEVDPEGLGPGPMGPTRMQVSKPVIAAIEGYAVAGGLELALLCDLRVAAESAVFGVFCRRWGVPLIDGGTVRLPRIIGQGRANDLILTGRAVGADEALSIGLADRVAAPGTALTAALDLAESLTRFPQGCLRADFLSARMEPKALAAALRREWVSAPMVKAEGIAGARRFAQGAGRGGRFD